MYYGKYKCIFNTNENDTIINNLHIIENHILERYKCNKNKNKIYDNLQIVM